MRAAWGDAPCGALVGTFRELVLTDSKYLQSRGSPRAAAERISQSIDFSGILTSRLGPRPPNMILA